MSIENETNENEGFAKNDESRKPNLFFTGIFFLHLLVKIVERRKLLRKKWQKEGGN